MNWSCLPTGSRSRSISIWQACSASACGLMTLRWRVCNARSSAVVKLPDEPRPVPAGMSAMLAISTRSSAPTSSMAARMIGCLMSRASSTRSSSEYLRM